MPSLIRCFLTAALTVLISLSISSQSTAELSQNIPEFALQTKQQNMPVYSSGYMVITAHANASDAAAEILNLDGNMIDAAIAAQLVLGLVEPQSSGIGGGGFLLSFDGQHIRSFDGRETAPTAVDETLFLTKTGSAMAFFEAVVGGRSVGVPGLVSMLELAHNEQGKLPWKQLFTPAIRLAKQGFIISPRLHHQLQEDPYLRKNPEALHYFYNSDGSAKAAGTRLKNPAYARTLRQLAKRGSKGLMQGPLARNIVQTVQHNFAQSGALSLDDLTHYNAIERSAICFEYRNHTICGPNAPSSGTITIGLILGVLEHSSFVKESSFSTSALHSLNEATRLAFADRGAYIADPEFANIPTAQLLSPTYLASRAKLIDASHILPKAIPGLENHPLFSAYYNGGTPEQASTSHISIVDANGHAVSLTSSIENQFGSRLMVDGFLLNNQLTDFSFVSNGPNGVVANRVQAGKRPRSSMSPLLVFDQQGKLAMVLGSPGGPLIISYLAQTLIELINWKQNPAQAVNAGHTFIGESPQLQLEQGYAWNKSTVDNLMQMGYTISYQPMTSGLAVITRHQTGWLGAVDPRREGSIAIAPISPKTPSITIDHE